MKSFNRRNFLGLIGSGAALTLVLPQLVKSQPPPPEPFAPLLPMVTVLSNQTLPYINGFTLPPNIDRQDVPAIMNAVYNLPVNGMTLIPQSGAVLNHLEMEAVQNWANSYGPTVGVGQAVPQLVIEIAIGIVILVVGGIVVYLILKKIDQWLNPPPNTNNSPAIRPSQRIGNAPIFRRSPNLR